MVTGLAASQGPVLRRFLASRLKRSLAEVPDLVQEVFLRFIRVNRLDAVRNPEAYLFGIARHVLHEYRSQSANALDTVDIADVISVLGEATDGNPESKLELQQRVEDYHRKLKSLPPNVYATLILNRMAGLTLEEVAGRLGVSRGMAKKYLATALRACRDFDGDEGQGKP